MFVPAWVGFVPAWVGVGHDIVVSSEGLSLAARVEITKKFAVGHERTSKAEKSLILVQVVAVSGWHRDHARQQLRRRLRLPKGRRLGGRGG